MDDYNDNYFDDGFDEDFTADEDLNGLDLKDNSLNDNLELEDCLPEDPLSFQNFLFWGGYLGMMIDEEREDRRLVKKIERESETENILDLDKKDED